MLNTEISQRVLFLQNKLNQLNYQYYVLNQSEVVDFEFDQLLKELEQLEQQYPEFQTMDSPTHRIGKDIQKDFKQVKHKRPMLSLSNTYSIEEINDFDERIRKEINGDPEYVCELKFDGTAIGITYINGILTQALTRGDGEQGDDVTANVRTINSLPLKLQGDFPSELEVRGEIFMPLSSFDKANIDRVATGQTAFANPRNAAAGTLKLLDPTEVAKRGLDCYIYFVLSDNLPCATHFDNLEKAVSWGFKVSPNRTKCGSISEIAQFLEYWDIHRKELPYDTDGVVIKLNDYAMQQSLGFRSKSPRWAVAYKFKAEQAFTPLLSISYQVGRTGAITPVANLQAVQLAGTLVKRASLHNADQIALHDIRLGDTVIVEKGGEIIPKIVGVDKSKRPKDSQSFEYISNCPECGTVLEKDPKEAKHYCPNDLSCPPQILGKIEHFVSRKAMNIDGLGSETIDLLFSEGLIKNSADLYDLTKDQLTGLERIGSKSADNIIAGIQQSKEIPFQRVVFALGIRFVGENTSKKLVEALGDLDHLRSATVEQLLAVDEVGERIANSIKLYFSDPTMQNQVDRLQAAGLCFKQDELAQQKLSNKLDGISIVISGNFTLPREELKSLIEKHGGKNVSSVSAATQYLLAGDKIGPAKLQKAEKLGIKIIDETSFMNMIELDNQ